MTHCKMERPPCLVTMWQENCFFSRARKDETILDKAEDEKKKDKELKPLEIEKMKHKSDAGGFIDMEQFTHIAIVNVASGELEQVTEGKSTAIWVLGRQMANTLRT